MKFNIFILATTLLFAMYDVVNPYDKIVHFLFFFSIFGILYHYFESWWIFLILFLFGVAIETTQVFIPGRYPDIIDIIANLLGSTAGVIQIFWLKQTCRM